jgi:hypothetical protein
MIFMIVIFLFPTTPTTNAQEMNYTIVVFGGFMSLAIFWYYCPVYGGVHWFNGPISNVAPEIDDEKEKEDGFVSDKAEKLTPSSVSVVYA